MAEIQSPLSGGLRVARRTVSAETFTGRAVPPPVAQPDPITTSLIQRNTLSLNTVSAQLQSISQQMVALSVSMQSVFTNISSNAVLERQKEIQNQNQERRLAEQQLREGKESAIERKMQGALIYPVQKIAAKATFTLTRLMGFFTTLLAGWLLNQGIQTIKAFAEGNTEKLNQIKDNVLKNLGIVAGVYAAIRFGIVGVVNIITRVTSRIFAAVASKIFLRPVQALLGGVKSAASWFISNFKKLIPGLGKAAAAAPAAAAAKPSGVGLTFKTLTGIGLQTAAGAGLDIALNKEDPARAVAGAGLGSIGSVPVAAVGKKMLGPLGAIALGGLAYMGFSDVGKMALDKVRGTETKQPPSTPTSQVKAQPPTPPPAQPKEQKVDQLKLQTLSSSQMQGETVAGSNQDFSKPPEFGIANIPMGAEDKTTKTTPTIEAKPAEAQIQPLKSETATKVEGIGPLPEVPPTVVPIPAQQPPQNPQPMGGQSGRANSVPTFSSSNPDNFYTLYSQVHYNVVTV